jgi:cytoskeletal protein CcmA (bactofilin family)
MQADKVSVIAPQMCVSGDLESAGDIRIDGTVNGNVFCKAKVVVIAMGKVFGDIQARQVDIHGQVVGNVTAGELLTMRSKSQITGNLITKKLQIEPNALFNGCCTMESEKHQKVTEHGELVEEA